MPSTYVPRGDAGVREWSRNFAAIIAADPVRYRVAPAEAAEAVALADAFAEKLTTALEPSTRTVVAVAAKNMARAALLFVLRRLAQRVRHDRLVTPEDKVALGLAPMRPARSRVPVPATSPQLSVVISASRVHTVRFADVANPTRRAKPRGVAGMQLCVTTGDHATPPAGSEGVGDFARFVSRQGVSIPFAAADVGRTAHYYARWQNAKGEVGPWSQVTSATVAA